MPDFEIETEMGAQAGRIVAGVDEAGRGPWAGPVVAGAAIIDITRVGEDLGILEDYTQHLPECLEGLGPSARDALNLYYRQHKRLLEIGSVLRRSEGAVKLLMFRARQALKMCLNGKINSGQS